MTTPLNNVVVDVRAGQIALPVANGTTIESGDLVYWNAGTPSVTSIASDANIANLLGVTHDSNPIQGSTGSPISPTVYAGYVVVEWGKAYIFTATSGDSYTWYTPAFYGGNAQTITSQVTQASSTVTVGSTPTTGDTCVVNINNLKSIIYTVPGTALSVNATASAIAANINATPVINQLVVATTTGSSGVITITALQSAVVYNVNGANGNNIALSTTVTGGHMTATAGATFLASGTSGLTNIIGYAYLPQENDLGIAIVSPITSGYVPITVLPKDPYKV